MHIPHRYRLRKKISESANSTVHKVVDTRTKDVCVLKVLKDPAYLSQFKKEFTILQTITHPNIVKPLDFGSCSGKHRGSHYFTMEFVDGVSFVRFLKNASLEEFEEKFLQALQVISFIHEKGFIHCDLKPQNVFIDSAGDVKLVDFGFAQVLQSIVGDDIGGTITYIAPEVLRGEKPDIRADIYSLGIMGYESLAGEGAYRGVNPDTIVRAALNSQLPPVKQRNSEVPNYLNEIIMKMISKQRMQRFSDCGAIISAIERKGKRPGTRKYVDRVLFSDFIGREQYIETIAHSIEDAKGGQGKILLVEGIPGVGKTRFLKEVGHRLFIEGTAVCYTKVTEHTKFNLLCLVEAFEQVGAKLGKLREMVEAGTITCAGTGKQQFFQQCFEGLIKAIGNVPLVLLIDDVDFQDSIMIDFVRYLSGMVETRPILFVMTTETVPDALLKICRDRIYHNVGLVHMQGMSEEENEVFIKNMLGLEGNVEKLSNYLHERTAGNPFFTEELLKEIIEKRHLKKLRGNLEYDLVRIRKIRIPKRVDEFVSDRIRKISRKEREVLECASVIGDAAPFEWILSVSEQDESDTIRICEDLIQKQFFSSSVPGRLEFTHKIVRAILYKGISPARRKKIHSKVLSFFMGIEENFHILYMKTHHAFEARDEDAKALCLHLMREGIGRNDARRALMAFRWLTRLREVNALKEISLEQALQIGTYFGNTGDYPSAISIYEKLLETATKNRDRVEIRHYLITARSRTQPAGKTIESFEKLLKAKMSRDRRFEILLNLAGFLVRQEDYERAKKVYQRAIVLAKKGLRKKPLIGKLQYNLCILKNIEGDHKAAIAYARQIIETGIKYKHNYYVMLGLQSLGYVEHCREHFRDAIKHHRETLRYLQKDEILRRKLYVLTSLAQLTFLAGDHAESMDYFHDAMIEAKKLDDRTQIMFLNSVFGKLLAHNGEWERALPFLSSSIEIAKGLERRPEVVENQAEMLKLFALRGKVGDFLTLLGEIEHEHVSPEDVSTYYAVYLAQGVQSYEAGNYETAVAFLEKIVKGHDPRPAAEYRIQALLYGALCHGALHAPVEAMQCVREAKAIMQKTRADAWNLEADFVGLLLDGLKGGNGKRKSGLEKLLQKTRTGNRLLYGRILIAYGALLTSTFRETGEEKTIREALEALNEAKGIFEEMKSDHFVNSVCRELAFAHEQLQAIEVPAAKEGRYLDVIAKLGALIKNINNLEQLKSLFVSAAKALTGAERGIFLAFDREKDQLIATESDVDDATVADAKQFSLSVIKRVRKTKQPLIVHDAIKEGRFRKYESVRINKIRSILCIPVVSGDKVFGALYLDSRKVPWLFSREEKEFFIALSTLLADSLSRALDYKRMEDESTKLKQSLRVQFGPEHLIGQSEKMQLVFDKIERFAESNVPVLLLGESGTGKEVTARTIHSLSERKDKNFLVVDCSGLSPTLIESELFGYKKGAFTGAREDKLGLFEAANKGTLFIDEIAGASDSLQSRLLRFFDTNEVKRIGATAYTKVDTRIIVATNKDLYQRVQQGKFSEDLFYRLSKFIIALPPLRERKEDIKPLVDYYLDHFNVKHKKNIRGVSREVMDLVTKYDWAGNVRELVNEIEKWVFFCNKRMVTEEYVSDEIARLEIIFPPLTEEKNTYMRNYIMKVLSYSGGNVSKAARILKTDKKTIYRYLKK